MINPTRNHKDDRKELSQFMGYPQFMGFPSRQLLQTLGWR